MRDSAIYYRKSGNTVIEVLETYMSYDGHKYYLVMMMYYDNSQTLCGSLLNSFFLDKHEAIAHAVNMRFTEPGLPESTSFETAGKYLIEHQQNELKEQYEQAVRESAFNNPIQ